MSNQLKVGDVVTLKSGGPAMTVGDPVAHKGYVRCDWFCGSDATSGLFVADQLDVCGSSPECGPPPEDACPTSCMEEIRDGVNCREALESMLFGDLTPIRDAICGTGISLEGFNFDVFDEPKEVRATLRLTKKVMP